MRVSHETIYRSLFIQARGVLKKELIQHLRSQRHSGVGGQTRGQIVDAIHPGKAHRNRGPRHSRPLGGRSAGRHQEQSHCDLSGTSFAFYRARQSAQQRHRCCRGRTEPARSETPRIPAALADVGPRAGDGQTQELHGGHECESVLL